MATRKVRYKKLNTKTLLPVLREDQIDPNEYESLTTEQQIATGVEQAEENVSFIDWLFTFAVFSAMSRASIVTWPTHDAAFTKTQSRHLILISITYHYRYHYHILMTSCYVGISSASRTQGRRGEYGQWDSRPAAPRKSYKVWRVISQPICRASQLHQILWHGRRDFK